MPGHIGGSEQSDDAEQQQMTTCTKRKRKNATTSEDESEEDCDGAFVCVFEGCGKSFNREGKLADHLRTHTGEVLQPPPRDF